MVWKVRKEAESSATLQTMPDRSYLGNHEAGCVMSIFTVCLTLCHWNEFPWSAGSEKHCQRLRWKSLACGVVSCQGPSTCWRVIDSNSEIQHWMFCLGLKDGQGMEVGGGEGVSSRRPLQCQTAVRFPALCSNALKQRRCPDRQRTELDCISQPLLWCCELEMCVSGWLSLTKGIISDEYGHGGGYSTANVKQWVFFMDLFSAG